MNSDNAAAELHADGSISISHSSGPPFTVSCASHSASELSARERSGRRLPRPTEPPASSTSLPRVMTRTARLPLLHWLSNSSVCVAVMFLWQPEIMTASASSSSQLATVTSNKASLYIIRNRQSEMTSGMKHGGQRAEAIGRKVVSISTLFKNKL